MADSVAQEHAPKAPLVAFVIGASGFVGRAVVRELARQSVRTVAHVRAESARFESLRERFAALGVETNIAKWNEPAMKVAIGSSGATHVFGLIGTTRKQARAERIAGDPYEAIDYGLTKIAIDAAVATARNPRFALLSSIGVGPKSPAPYLRAHWKAEEALRVSTLPWVIARPSMIVSDGRTRRDDPRPFESIGGAVMDGLLATIGWAAPSTRARYRSITPEILAAALVRAALDGPPNVVLESDALR